MLRPEYQDAKHVKSNSLEELGINVEGFLRILTEYNDGVAGDRPFIHYKLDGLRTRGLRPDRTDWAQKTDTPPYQAWAAGEVTESFLYYNYPSETGLVRGAVMERIAGAEAAVKSR